MLTLSRANDGSWHLLARNGAQLVMSFVSQGDALEYVRDLKQRWDVEVTLCEEVSLSSPQSQWPAAAE